MDVKNAEIISIVALTVVTILSLLLGEKEIGMVAVGALAGYVTHKKQKEQQQGDVA